MMDYLVLGLWALAVYAAPSAGETINVSLGESPSFSCSLSDAAGVKQVTWQRLNSEESLHTMVTFSENQRPDVTKQYAEKVEVTLASLSATTLVIRNVTFADDGCYVCTFSVYPAGTKMEKKCLSVQGLSEIKTSRHPTKDEVVVSCSATGKPKPVIKWIYTNKEEPEVETINNEDGTVTVMENLTLPLSLYRGKHVKCVAQSGSMETSALIDVTEMPGPGGDFTRHYLATVSVVVICVICAISLGLVLHWRRSQWNGMETFGTIV